MEARTPKPRPPKRPGAFFHPQGRNARDSECNGQAEADAPADYFAFDVNFSRSPCAQEARWM